jgi:hypothetical protein
MTALASEVRGRIGRLRARRASVALTTLSLLLRWVSIVAAAHGQPPQ